MQPVAGGFAGSGVGLRAALAEIRPSHLFLTTWMRRPTEAGKSGQRRDGAQPARSCRRRSVAACRAGDRAQALSRALRGLWQRHAARTPFREEQPRLAVENFYYAQEDEVFAAASATASAGACTAPYDHRLCHRQRDEHGCDARGLCHVCRETGRPFLFPGSPTQWNGLTDMTDARLLARQLEWAATRGGAQPPSTSSTAISSAGAGCGRGSPAISA